MTESRNRRFAKLAKDVDASGDITTAAIATDVSFGVDVYDSAELLPYVGNTAGDQAFVNSNNRLYIWQGSGWYNVALINRAPTIASVQDSDGNTTPFRLSTEGAVTTITITAADSDGDPITYSATADSDFNGLASITNDGNEFTITPFSQDSATATSGTITFKATDSVNIASSGVQTFTLNFLSALWDETVLSIGTNSSDGLANSTFIDRSTNAHTVAPTGSPVQTAFHPYLENWSVEFDGTDDVLSFPNSSEFVFGTGAFTIEFWINAPLNNDKFILEGRNAIGTMHITFGGFQSTAGVLRYIGSSTIVSSNVISDGSWHHCAIVRDGSNNITIYVDGVSDGTGTDTTNYTNSGGTFNGIGGRAGVGNYMTGSLSNLRIIKGSALYTSNFTPPTEKLTAVSGTSLLTCQSNRFIDNSSNDHAITVAGDPKISAFNPFGQESEYVVGENKGSTYFSGSGNYLDFGQQSEYVIGTNDFDVSFWVYPEYPLNVSENPIIKMYSDGGVTLEARLVNANISFQFGSSGSDDRTILDGSEDLRAYQWNYIRVGRDASNLYIFVNGVLDTSTSSTQNVTDTTYIFYMNSNQLGSSGREQYISDFYFSNGNGCGTSSFTPPTSPIGNTNASLYLPFDNAGIFDKTGLNTLTPVGNASTSTTQTKFADTAVYFDGNGDYVNTSKQIIDSPPFTCEMWFYVPNGVSLVDMFLVNQKSTLLTGFALGWIGDGRFAFGFDITSEQNILITNPFSAETWHHVAATIDASGNAKLFADGTQVGANSATGTLTGLDLEIGRRSGSNDRYFNGYIENFQILKGVAKYTANFTVPSQEQGRTYQAED